MANLSLSDFVDEGTDLMIPIEFTEKEWRFISVCLKIARDSEELCEECLEELYDLHYSLCEQVINFLNEYIEEKENEIH